MDISNKNYKKKLIILGKGPATAKALNLAKKILNNNWEINYFFLDKENRDFNNIDLAKHLEIKIKKIDSYKHLSKLVLNINPDYLLLTQCTLIIKKDLLKLLNKRILNLHHGNLPKYRGMGPITNALLNGEILFGVSIHFVEEKIDSGEIIEQIIFDIEGLNNEEVYSKCINNDEKALRNILQKIKVSQELIGFKQDEDEAQYFSKESLCYSNPVIDFNKSSEEVLRYCRAYYFPSKNLFPLININSKIYFSKNFPRIDSEKIYSKDYCFNNSENTLSVKCKDNWIKFTEIEVK